jgi:2Fe-2S ferredoxin
MVIGSKQTLKPVLPMAKIEIENLFGKILTTNDTNKSLLQHFHENNLDWMHACGGKGRCTTCKVIVVGGMENFSSITPAEHRYRLQGALNSNERLSCQTRAIGDVVISAPKEYMLPHVKYSD